MAILASLEVDDEGTLKIRNFRDALSDLGASVVKAKQEMATANASGAASAKQQVDALTQLTAAARAANAEQSKYGQGFSVLSQQLKAGATVSQVQADALRQLAAQTQTNTKFTQQYGAELANLSKSLAAGQQVTPQLAASLQKVAQGHKEAAAGANEQANGVEKLRLDMAAAAAVLELFGAELFGELKSAAELAARIETLGVVLNRTAKNAGVSTFALQTQVQQVKSLGITTQEATETVLQLVRANIDLSKSTELARAAQNLAVAAGENSSQTLGRLMAVIQTGNAELLRQVGIVTTAQQAYNDYGKTIGIAGNKLDEHQKKQALLTLILEKAKMEAGAYEEAMSTAGKQLTSFARYTEEAEAALGKALIPTLGLAIETATNFLKFWLALSPAMQAAATAILAGAAAVAMFAGALAAAKFLGVIELVEKLAAAFVELRAAVAMEGAAGGIALFISELNPVVAILTALGVVLGVATAAWVYFSAAVDKSVDNELKSAAVAQSQINTLEEQRAKINALSKSHEDAETKQKKYNDAVQAITKIAPEAGAAIRSLGGNYQAINAEVDKAIAKQQDLKRALLQGAQAKETIIKQEMDEAQKAQTDANASLIAIQQQIAQVKSGKPIFEQVLANAKTGGFKTVAVDLETLEERLKRATAASAQAVDPLKELTGEYKRTHDQIESLRLSLPEFADEAKKANKALVDAAIKEAAASYGNLAERLKIAGKTMKDLTNAPDVPSLKNALDEINTAWDAHVKKMQADAKRYQQTFETTFDRITDLTKTERAQFDALNKALGQSGLSQEEYNRRVQAGAAILNDYAKKPDALVKSFKNLEAGYQSLLKQSYDQEFGARVEKITKQFADLNQASLTSIASFTEEFRKNSQAADIKLELDQKAQNDRIYDQDRALYEKLVVSKMRQVDQEIYAENKRIDDIVRAAAKEKEARQKEIDDARRVVEEKAKLLQRELQDKVDKIRLDAQLEDAAAIASIQRNQKLTDAEKAARIRGVQDAAQVLNNQLNQYQQIASARIAVAEGEAQAEIDNRQRTVNQMNVLTDQQTKKEIDGSKQVKAEIIKNHNELRNALMGLSKQIASDFVAGIFSMVDGTKSFKDVIVGIFNSIKQALMNVVQQMVQSWIDGLFKMKAASQASGAAGGGGGGGGGMSALGPGGMYGKATPYIGAGAAGMAGGSIAAGLASHWIDGNYGKGIAVGAAGGAAAGAAYGSVVPGIGTGVGALVGLGVGAFSGWMQARKDRKQMQSDRDQLVKDMGGLEAFKQKATEAGFAYDKLLNTKSPKEFGSEIKKLQEALDKMDLKKSREELIQTSGGLAELSKKMQLVGFDSTKLFQTKSVTEYNAEVDKLNKLLAEQQKRLEALGTAAGGLNTAVQGMGMRLDKALSDITAKMSKAEKDALDDAFKKAQEGGFKGSQNQFLAQQAKLYQSAQEGDPRLKMWLSGDTMTAFIKAQKDAQKEFNNLGMAASATFGAILAETGDINQAMNAIGDSLDAMIQLQSDWGLTADGSFQKLLQFRQVIKDNEDIATSLSGLTQIIKGLGEAGALDADTFNAMGDDAATMFQTLLDRGVDSNQAMLMMQPTLQALWEAQKEFGFQTDEATQKLIDQGVAAGMVGEKQQSINKQMLDVLLLIAKTLGADLPSAYEAMAGAAEGAGTKAGGALGGITNRAREAKRAWEEMGDAAEDAGRRAEDAATATAEGRSPTGIQQIVVRLKESKEAYKDFAQSAAADSRYVEDAATKAANAAQAAKDAGGINPAEVYAQTQAARAAAAAANGGYAPTQTDTASRPGSAAPGDGSSQPAPNLTVQVSPEIKLSSLDGSDAADIVRDQIGPELLNLALSNTDQFAILFEQALERYRRRE